MIERQSLPLHLLLKVIYIQCTIMNVDSPVQENLKLNFCYLFLDKNLIIHYTHFEGDTRFWNQILGHYD